MQITESLEALGLNEKEAKVYAALLQLGRGSAYSVATKSGLKKPTTYVILGDLMQKGLVLKVPREKKQLFVAKSPDEFFALAEERLNMAKRVLPQLMAMAGEGRKVKSLFYEGIGGVRQAMWYRLKEMVANKTEVVGFYGAVEGAPKELTDLFFEWDEEAMKKGLRVRGITPAHASLEPWDKFIHSEKWDFKIVPFEQYSANISIDVGDTFVRIVQFRDVQAVIIENPDVARTVKQIFEMVWGCLPIQKAET